MEELLGVGNPGFSFTDTYLHDICNFIEYIDSHKLETQSYIEIQQNLGDPSRVRMFVPFLRHLGILNESLFEQENTRFLVGSLIVKSGEPFVYCFRVYSSLKELNETKEIATKNWKKIFKEVMFKFYLTNLVKNKNEYLDIIRFLLKNDTIDKFEFFVVTSFKYNGKSHIFGEKTIEKVVEKYRNELIEPSLYTFKTNVNCYAYMMAILSDFDVCIKDGKKYKIIDKERIIQKLGGLL